jgi:hypothetical protein
MLYFAVVAMRGGGVEELKRCGALDRSHRARATHGYARPLKKVVSLRPREKKRGAAHTQQLCENGDAKGGFGCDTHATPPLRSFVVIERPGRAFTSGRGARTRAKRERSPSTHSKTSHPLKKNRKPRKENPGEEAFGEEGWRARIAGDLLHGVGGTHDGDLPLEHVGVIHQPRGEPFDGVPAQLCKSENERKKFFSLTAGGCRCREGERSSRVFSGGGRGHPRARQQFLYGLCIKQTSLV